VESLLKGITRFDNSFLTLKEKVDQAGKLYKAFNEEQISMPIKEINNAVKSLNKELPALLNTFNSCSERFNDQKDSIFQAIEKSKQVLASFDEIGDAIANIAEIKDSLKAVSENGFHEKVEELKSSFDGYFPDLTKFIDSIEKSNRSIKKDANEYCEKVGEVMDSVLTNVKSEIKSIESAFVRNKEDIYSVFASMNEDTKISVKDAEINILNELKTLKDSVDENSTVNKQTITSGFSEQASLLLEIKKIVSDNTRDFEDVFLTIMGIEEKLDNLERGKEIFADSPGLKKEEISSTEEVRSIRELIESQTPYPFRICKKTWPESTYYEVMGLASNGESDYLYILHKQGVISEPRNGLIDDNKVWIIAK
jgi:predicted  nucleic acid-binding Zn-ribbon protein